MAEQVNQRIEGMINELEQMRRTELYDDDQIREISVKRKELEYRIQRRVKEKEDFVQYIAYELALLEDISLRRKQAKLTEKRKDIEFAITKRLNRVFKQFIFRFQDVNIYFEYIKFCQSVGFKHAVSTILGQMLQIHGDKPKMWQMASKWESKEQNNLENARNFLLKGIHRHSDAELLYLDLFDIELMIAFQTEEEEQREKYLKRADVVWRNGLKNIQDATYLFKLCNCSLKYEIADKITTSIKGEIWERRIEKDVWPYIASKELEGCHWFEIEKFVNVDEYPEEINNYMGVYEEALQQFPDEKLCTKYIHGLLSLSSTYNDSQKISFVKHAWYHGHDKGLLTYDMYVFGIRMLKLEDEVSKVEFIQILDDALIKKPQYKFLWEEKLQHYKSDEDKLLFILKESSKHLKSADMIALWNFMFDNVESNVVLQNCYNKFQACESAVVLSLKPKLLKKIYEHNGVKAARQVYEDFIRTPPTQEDVHRVMIEIELSQDKPSVKNIRKCYEVLIQHHGNTNIQVWMDFIKFEQETGSAQAVPAIHRRAIGMLEKKLVDDFIKAQALAKLK